LCFLNILPRFVVFFLGIISNPPAAVGLSIAWVYLKSLIEIRDRLVILPFLPISTPPIVVGLGIPRLTLLLLSRGTAE
jgi:ABC-type Fe3+ transport system permease subunit